MNRMKKLQVDLNELREAVLQAPSLVLSEDGNSVSRRKRLKPPLSTLFCFFF